MDWAHLLSVHSPYAVKLQHEMAMPVAVEKEDEDNLDERSRVLREVNRFKEKSSLRFKTELARNLVKAKEFRRPDGAIGTAILDPKPDAFAPFAHSAKLAKSRGAALKDAEEGDGDLSPRAASGQKEVLRATVLMRRAEMARDFPHMCEWALGPEDATAAADPDSLSDDPSTDEEPALSNDDESLSPPLAPPPTEPEVAEEPQEPPPAPVSDEESTELRDEEEGAQIGTAIPLPPTELAQNSPDISDTRELANLRLVAQDSPRPTTSGEPASPRLATPLLRPQTVPGSVVAGLDSGRGSAMRPVVLSPWHLDSLANRSRQGLSTQLSEEFLPLVMTMNNSPVPPHQPTPPRTGHPTADGKASPRRTSTANRDGSARPRPQRLSKLQQQQQQDERRARGRAGQIAAPMASARMSSAPRPQTSPERWLRPPHGTSLASIATNRGSAATARVATELTPNLAAQFSGMDVLAAARAGGASGCGGSTSARGPAISLAPPRPPIPSRHFNGSSASLHSRGSSSARPSTTWAVDDEQRGGVYALDSWASIGGHGAGGEPAHGEGYGGVGSRTDGGGVHAEISMSSLLSQSSRRVAQTHRSSGGSSGVGRETSQSSFTRMRKRGGLATRDMEKRATFGGGFSAVGTSPRQPRGARGGARGDVGHTYGGYSHGGSSTRRGQ
jgi:hypothetical protein